jgi:hypothetical protein
MTPTIFFILGKLVNFWPPIVMTSIVGMSTTGGQMLTSLPKIKKIVDVITTEGQKFTSLPKIKKIIDINITCIQKFT